MLKETKIHNTFTLVNAYSLKPEDKIRLESKYAVDPHFFKYIEDSSEIPRFREGSRPEQSLFILDVPAHHKNTTVPVGVVIDDNTSIVIFTDNDTKYIIPIVSRLLNENVGQAYGAQDVALDTAHELTNFYLDKIKGVDRARVKDKALLKDKSKHRNSSYINHLSYLKTLASGYVYSLSSDYSLLCSIREIMNKVMSTNQEHALRNDLIEYRQAKQEATFCYKRINAILGSFSMKVHMGNSKKLSFLSIIAYICSPSSLLWTLFGINTHQPGFPIQEFSTMFILGIVLDVVAWITWHYWINRN